MELGSWTWFAAGFRKMKNNSLVGGLWFGEGVGGHPRECVNP